MAHAYKCEKCRKYIDDTVRLLRAPVFNYYVTGNATVEVTTLYKCDNGNLMEIHYCIDCLFSIVADNRRGNDERSATLPR